MKVFVARNVHSVLPQALKYLFHEGVKRDSRNGPVLQSPVPVTTVYESPCERVMFWPERDCNPFFHLYESLWMLAGRCDVAGPSRYAANMLTYSDNGVSYHGAYGHRWRKHFYRDGAVEPFDQLKMIITRLSEDSTDRRSVLQMWDPTADLCFEGKDFPCNVSATFQINPAGKLDLSLFCRSNDIVWGAYGANAVHFSFLLEYMAIGIGVPVGRFYQTSVNWHGYLSTLEKVAPLRDHTAVVTPYDMGDVYSLPLGSSVDSIDAGITSVLFEADHSFMNIEPLNLTSDFMVLAWQLLRVHLVYKTQGVEKALEAIRVCESKVDWTVACREWLQRRVR